MQDSPCEPTPTPQGRSRTKPRRRWAASWRRSCEQKKNKKYRRGGKTSSPILFHPFHAFLRVGHGVGQQLTHILTHTFFGVFATKKHRKPKFSMLFGAAGQIRTADLILTNCRRAFQPLLFKAFRQFFVQKGRGRSLFVPLLPSAHFPVWVTVWVRVSSTHQETRAEHQI